MSLLHVANLSKRFGGVRAVNSMTFSVERGEILGLIGPNGSGKSTTLSLLMGIVRPDSGEIRLSGVDICGWPPHRVANSGIGMAFQHSRPLHRQDILENIKLALLPNTIFQLGVPQRLIQKAHRISESVGLDNVINQYPDTLPYAGLRRLELANAIALDPAVLLLDEPFAGLAPAEVREFTDLVVSLRNKGHAIILVDHNVKAVAGIADRTVVMHAGAKIAEGTPREVAANSRVREVYLGGSLEDSRHAAVSGTTVKKDASTAQPLLDVRAASVHYGKAQALRDMSMTVFRGEFVSVVGVNGAGKSTLFKSIMGFVNYEGDIRWSDASSKGKTSADIVNSGIAMCPETRELFLYMSVRENLELGGQHLSKEGMTEELRRVFQLFPILRDRQKQPAYLLSGGEQQQLTIGRALMQKPRLLVLDEPTLGLAPLVIEDISRALVTLREETGLTILLGEQNLTFALKHSNRIYLLETGVNTWRGSTDSFLKEVGDSFL